MSNGNTFSDGALFSPTLIDSIKEGGAAAEDVTLAALSGSSTGSNSFAFDAPGSAFKSTQQIPLDWNDYAKHTFFNSAESKVNVAFDTLINYFPFDGTKSEITEFLEDLNGFEYHVLKRFPKYKGFLHFSGSGKADGDVGTVISVTDRAGSLYPALSKDTTAATIIDPLTDSISFEFFLSVAEKIVNGAGAESSTNDNQVIFQKLYEDTDVSGNRTGQTDGISLVLSHSSDSTKANLLFLATSGSAALSASCEIPKGGWHPVAAYFEREPTSMPRLRLYLSGALVATSSDSYDMGRINFAAQPLLFGSGSIHTLPGKDYSFVPKQTLSGALDEFKVYHGARNIHQIKNVTSASQYSESNLKLYYKFNEATGSYQGNNTALDSSGNSLHAQIKNYFPGLREKRNLSDPLVLEDVFLNPVLFPANQKLVDLNVEMLASASTYDANNPNLITNLVPQHYLVAGAFAEGFDTVSADTGAQYGYYEDFPGGGKVGSPQIIASLLFTWAKFFDDIKIFIDHFGNLLRIDYDSEGTVSNWMLPFLANYYGFSLPNSFSAASISQYLDGQDLTAQPSLSNMNLRDIQSEIWRRILINMNDVIRSKGTIHGIKAVMRASGINPDNIFRFREFGGSSTITTEDNRIRRDEVSTLLAMTQSGDVSLRTPYLSGSRTAPGYPIIKGRAGVFRLDQVYTSSEGRKYSNSGLSGHWRFRKESAVDMNSVGTPISGTYCSGSTFFQGSSRFLSTHNKSVSDSVIFNNSPFTDAVLDRLQTAKTLPTMEFGSSGSGGFVMVTGSSPGATSSGGSTSENINKWPGATATGSMGPLDFSIGGWFQFEPGNVGAGAEDRTLWYFGSGSDSRGNWRCYIDSSTLDSTNLYVYGIDFDGTNLYYRYKLTGSDGDNNFGDWKHIMFTYDATNSTSDINRVKFYLNGDYVPYSSTAVAGGTGIFQGTWRKTLPDLWFGVTPKSSLSSAANRDFFTGSMAEWAMWKRVLTDDEAYLIGKQSWPDGNMNAKVYDYVPWWNYASSSDGMFTSASFTYEAMYKFTGLQEMKYPATRSLAQMYVTGSSTDANRGGLVANLIAIGTGSNSNATGSLMLYARPGGTTSAPTMKLALTGLNVFDTNKWHVSFGRDIGSSTGSFATASWFLRAGRQSYGELVEYHRTSSMFYEGANDVLSNITPELNASGAFIVINSSSMVSVDQDGPWTGGTLFLNSSASVSDNRARIQTFNGHVGHIRFWSKDLSVTADMEHTRNFKSLGVEDPVVNFNFVTSESGSFERLRIDASTDQVVTQSDSSGEISLVDFSQNNYYLTGSGFPTEQEIIKPVQFHFSILNPKFDERSTMNKIRVRGFEQAVNIEEFKTLKAPVRSIPAGTPVTDDTRFSIEVSSVRALNDDIVNVLASLAFFDNAIGDPELVFSDAYPRLEDLRNVYFQRLTERVNYKNMLEFYKWFDDSLSLIINNLIPRSTKYLGINFVIESHMLERPKMRYLQSDIYLGENDRRGLQSDIFLQQIVGVLKKF